MAVFAVFAIPWVRAEPVITVGREMDQDLPVTLH